MGLTEFSGIEYADGGDAANPAFISLKLSRDVDKFSGVFPTESARDLAKIAYLAVPGRVANDFLGARAYITQRAGWCYWRGDKWVWETTHDLLVDQHWSGPGGYSAPPTAPTALLSGTFTLPGTGLRRLQITAKGNLTSSNGGGGARIYVTGTGITSGEGILQSWVDWAAGVGDRYRQTVSGTWHPTATGTQTYSLLGTVEGSLAFMLSGDMILQVMDLGPSD